MSFLKLRISGRLYGGFGLLLLFCAGLAGFAVWQLNVIQSQIDGMRVQSENALRSSEIVGELHAARRAILRFAFDQDEASFAESEKRLSKTNRASEASRGDDDLGRAARAVRRRGQADR